MYISAFYYVTTTISTVGYGDIYSKTGLECLFTILCEFFGIALFGYISGGLVSAVKLSLLAGSLERSKRKGNFDTWLFQREKNKTNPLEPLLVKDLLTINRFNTENNFSGFFNEAGHFRNLPRELKRRVFNLLFTDIAVLFAAFFKNFTELKLI